MDHGDLDIGFDLGTSNTKVVAVDATGALVASASLETDWTHLGGGRAERDPVGMLATIDDLLERVATAARARLGHVRVRSIGFASLAETGVLLDRQGRPAYPLIAWFDPRGQAQLDDLPVRIRTDFRVTTGLDLTTVPTLFKLMWLHDNGIRLNGSQWLGLPEYICHHLGGARATDISLFGRTGLIDVATRGAWPSALDLLHVTPEFLPPIVASGAPLGRVRDDHRVEEVRGAVLTVAGHDHLVAAAEAGAARPGFALDSMGTAEAILAVSERLPPAADRERLAGLGLSVSPHVVDGLTSVLAGLKGGFLLARILRMVGGTNDPARHELDARAAALWPQHPAAVTVRGVGMNDQAITVTVDDGELDPALVWLAALGHVTDRARELLAIIESAGIPATTLVVAGGPTHLASVRASRRSLVPDLAICACDQPGIFGAARLAARAAGLNDDRADLSTYPAPAIDVFPLAP